MHKPRNWRHYLWAWLPVVLAVSCIALESQPWLGSDHTTGPLRWLVERFVGPITAEQWAPVHHIIRKTGHFLGYGLVSLTWFRAFWMSFRTDGFRDRNRGSRKLWVHLLAMAGTFLVASSDEFHQTFLPNRTGNFHDVLLDCSGALTVQLVIFLVMLRFFRDERLFSY